MITFKQFLAERVISIGFDQSTEPLRDKYRDDLAAMIQTTYSKLDGGYGGNGIGTDAEYNAIINDIDKSLIKMVIRDGKVTACGLYKPHHGRKSVAAATNGTPQGKADFMMIKREDHIQQRAWGEYSGAVQHIQTKLGVPVIPADEVGDLIGKPVKPHNDNQHYDRQIGGHMKTKQAMGYPKR